MIARKTCNGTVTCIAWLLPTATFFALCIWFILTGYRVGGGIWPALVDDAYIHAQYAKNFTRGMLYTWSPDSGYSKGATSALYPLILTVGYSVGFREHWIMLFAHIVNVAAASAGIYLLWRLLCRHTTALIATSTAMLWSVCGFLVCGAVSGMETGIATAGVIALMWCTWDLLERGELPRWNSRFAAVGAALPLLRPEAILAVGVCWAFVSGAGALQIWRDRARVHASTILQPLICGVLCVLPLAAFLSLNWMMTGDPIPNSMKLRSIWSDPFRDQSQKGSFWQEKISNLPGELIGSFGPATFGLLSGAVALVLLALSLWPCGIRLRLAILCTWIVVAVEFCFMAGQRDVVGTGTFRYLQPYVPPLFLLAGIGAGNLMKAAVRLSQRPGQLWFQRAVALLPLVLVAGSMPALRQIHELYIRNSQVLAARQIPIGRYIAKVNREKPGTYKKLISHDAGAPMYFSDINGFDVIGLCMQLPGYELTRAAIEGAFAPFEAIERCLTTEELPDVAAMFSPMWQSPCYTADLIADPATFPDALPMNDRNADMKLYRFPREFVRSAEMLPAKFLPKGWRLVDHVDFADLRSEEDHEVDWRDKTLHYVMDAPALTDLESTPTVVDISRHVTGHVSGKLHGLEVGHKLRALARMKAGDQGGWLTMMIGESETSISLKSAETTITQLAELSAVKQSAQPFVLKSSRPCGMRIGYMWILQAESKREP